MSKESFSCLNLNCSKLTLVDGGVSAPWPTGNHSVVIHTDQ